jgi:hypothetical protein
VLTPSTVCSIIALVTIRILFIFLLLPHPDLRLNHNLLLLPSISIFTKSAKGNQSSQTLKKKHGYIYGDSQSAPCPSPPSSSHHGTPPHNSSSCSTETLLQVKAQLKSDRQFAYTHNQSISRLGQDTVLAGMRWATSYGGNTLHARAQVCRWGSKPHPDTWVVEMGARVERLSLTSRMSQRNFLRLISRCGYSPCGHMWRSSTAGRRCCLPPTWFPITSQTRQSPMKRDPRLPPLLNLNHR